MNVVIYCRVSTEKQDVDQQREYCKTYADRQGWDVVYSVKDKMSGRKDLKQRPRFMKFIKDEYNFGYDAVLVYDLDRLTRNWDDVTMIEAYFRENWERVKLLSCRQPVDLSTAHGRFMFRILMAASCHMPEQMLERQKIGISRAKKQGKYKGRKVGSTNL